MSDEHVHLKYLRFAMILSFSMATIPFVSSGLVVQEFLDISPKSPWVPTGPRGESTEPSRFFNITVKAAGSRLPGYLTQVSGRSWSDLGDQQRPRDFSIRWPGRLGLDPGLSHPVSVGADGAGSGSQRRPGDISIQWSMEVGNKIPGYLVQIHVGTANAVWGINGSQQIFQYNGQGGWNLIPGKSRPTFGRSGRGGLGYRRRPGDLSVQ